MIDYTAKDGSEWEGAIPDESGEYLRCKKCGNAFIQMVSCFDGRNTYGYTYNCKNGHAITRTFKRRLETMYDLR